MLEAKKVEIASWPKLKNTLRAGFGLGVYALTATTTIVVHIATGVPKRTYAAIFTANATEIALERKRTTGLRWATPARARMRRSIAGSISLVRMPIDETTSRMRPSPATSVM